MGKPRPLSPHLQVYRPQLTSILSIAHRISGVILASGSLLLVLWLWAVANGPQTYALMAMVLEHPLGQFVLFGYSVVLFYHAMNGIRHLGWDLGYGLSLPQIYRNGYAVLGATLVLTALLWGLVWFV